MKAEYYKCEFCGQVVQGYNASQDIKCCEKQDGFHWERVYHPRQQGVSRDYLKEMDYGELEELSYRVEDEIVERIRS